LVLVKVTTGGSRLCVNGANDVNGCWSVDFAGITADNPATIHLTAEFETKWGEWEAFCIANSHTFEVKCGWGKQGEADVSAPRDYLTEFTNWIPYLRTIVGDATLPIMWGTVPLTSSGFCKVVRDAQIAYSFLDDNFFLKDLSSGTLSDDVHISEDTGFDLADWLVAKYNEIDTPIVPVAQNNRYVFNNAVNLITSFNAHAKYLSRTGIVDSTISAAVEYIIDSFQTVQPGLTVALWDKIPAFWPICGDIFDQHKVNAKNGNIFDLGAIGASHTHSATGWQLPGVSNNYIRTTIKPSDITGMSALNFGADFYSRTNQVNADVVDVTIKTAASLVALRLFTSWTSASAKMRFDIEDDEVSDGSFNLQSPLALTDTLGLISFQVNPSTPRAEIFHKGVFLNSKNFTTTNAFNENLEFGYDGVGAARWSGKEYSFLGLHDAFSTDEMTVYNSTIQTFQTMLGRQVL